MQDLDAGTDAVLAARARIRRGPDGERTEAAGEDDLHAGSGAQGQLHVLLSPWPRRPSAEDYVGASWTEETGPAKCTMRGGTYSAEPCSNRKAETDTFEGTECNKGQCVLKCGTPDEYTWNSYSEPSDGTRVRDRDVDSAAP